MCEDLAGPRESQLTRKCNCSSAMQS